MAEKGGVQSSKHRPKPTKFHFSSTTARARDARHAVPRQRAEQPAAQRAQRRAPKEDGWTAPAAAPASSPRTRWLATAHETARVLSIRIRPSCASAQVAAARPASAPHAAAASVHRAPTTPCTPDDSKQVDEAAAPVRPPTLDAEAGGALPSAGVSRRRSKRPAAHTAIAARARLTASLLRTACASAARLCSLFV